MNWNNKIMIAAAFAVAMGFLEAVVVVYLRVIYFPDGFDFPVPWIENRIYNAELVREITTLIMLAAVGMLAGSTRNGKFAWFLYVFGIWDIAYYAGLKVFLNWPASLLTWDILFLIPVVWVGPVLAPVICALTMVLLGLIVMRFEHRGYPVRFGGFSWSLLLIGSLLIFTAYIQDFMTMLYAALSADGEVAFTWGMLREVSTDLVPESFNWVLFAAGELLILYAVYRIYRANKPRGSRVGSG